MSLAQPSNAGETMSPDALTDRTFERIQAFGAREAGLSIPDSKRAMVQSRIARRLAAVGQTSFDNYLDFVEGNSGGAEKDELLSVLVTNVSHFFREEHHFDTLSKDILPGLMQKAARGERVRIWSAACSSGQEPYTIAMCILEAAPNAAQMDVKILATDIDKNILTKSRAGEYDAGQIDGIPNALRKKYLQPAGQASGAFSVVPALRDLITFRRLNLMHDWPMKGQFDVIFCRNVVIYFSQETQEELWPRFESKLHPDGWLFLGHSERIRPGPHTQFEAVGITTYRRGRHG